MTSAAYLLFYKRRKATFSEVKFKALVQSFKPHVVEPARPSPMTFGPSTLNSLTKPRSYTLDTSPEDDNPLGNISPLLSPSDTKEPDVGWKVPSLDPEPSSVPTVGYNFGTRWDNPPSTENERESAVLMDREDERRLSLSSLHNNSVEDREDEFMEPELVDEEGSGEKEQSVNTEPLWFHSQDGSN
jgi:hypothetical protein